MILGLTGSIGGGKSTVRKFFQAHNWYGADADELCKALWNPPDAALQAEIVERFGETLFDDGGKLDKGKIAAAIFASAEKMRSWTGLLYPRLRERLQAEIRQCRERGVSGVFEVPLLFEGGFAELFDQVMMVWTPENIRMQRLSAGRGASLAECRQRQAWQMSDAEKLERADIGIINTGNEEFLFSQLQKFLTNIEN